MSGNLHTDCHLSPPGVPIETASDCASVRRPAGDVMRWRAVACVGCLVPLTGCNLAYYAGHNLANESISRVDEARLAHRLRAEAKAAWFEVCRQHAGRTLTSEFAEGFVEGYADYLEHGGTPRPPAVPPPRYRRSGYLSPEGHVLIKDYLAGFQYGAEVACATGRRQFLTVPVLVSEEQPEPPLSLVKIPAPPETPSELMPPPVGPPPSAPSSGLPDPKPIPPPPLPPKTDAPGSEPLPPVEVPTVLLPPLSRPDPLPAAPVVQPASAELPATVPPVADRPPPLPPTPELPKQ